MMDRATWLEAELQVSEAKAEMLRAEVGRLRASRLTWMLKALELQTQIDEPKETA